RRIPGQAPGKAIPGSDGGIVRAHGEARVRAVRPPVTSCGVVDLNNSSSRGSPAAAIRVGAECSTHFKTAMNVIDAGDETGAAISYVLMDGKDEADDVSACANPERILQAVITEHARVEG